MATRFYYRLAKDQNSDKALWSGAVTVKGKPSKADAREAIRNTLHVERLPAHTLVVSARELEQGKWNAKKIREATVIEANPDSVKVFAETVADVPLSLDDVQAMLKKLGL